MTPSLFPIEPIGGCVQCPLSGFVKSMEQANWNVEIFHWSLCIYWLVFNGQFCQYLYLYSFNLAVVPRTVFLYVQGLINAWAWLPLATRNWHGQPKNISKSLYYSACLTAPSANDMVTQGARTSAHIVLTSCAQNIPLPMWEPLLTDIDPLPRLIIKQNWQFCYYAPSDKWVNYENF